MPAGPTSDRWIADRMRTIEMSGIRKMFELASSLKDPVNLSIGQPDFDVPQPIKAAAHAAIDQGFNGYTPTQGIPQLREKLYADIHRLYPHADRDLFLTSGTSGEASSFTSRSTSDDASRAVSGGASLRCPLSVSVSGSEELADSRARANGGPPPRANPMVGKRRVPLEREWLQLVGWVATSTGEHPEHVAPPFRGRSVLNPADLTDDRLLRDLIDLRRRKDVLEHPPKARDPAEVEREEQAWRDADKLADEFLRWYEENPDAGLEQGRQLHGLAYTRWPKWKEIPEAPRAAVFKAAMVRLKDRRAG